MRLRLVTRTFSPRATSPASTRVGDVDVVLFIEADPATGLRVRHGVVDVSEDQAAGVMVRAMQLGYQVEVLDGEVPVLALSTQPTVERLPAPPATPDQSVLDAFAMVLERVLELGWAEGDIGDLGGAAALVPGAPRSAVTGLTMGEMALASAPAEWPEFRDKGYPWSCPSWVPPVPGWLVPERPAKARPQTEAAGQLVQPVEVLVDEVVPVAPVPVQKVEVQKGDVDAGELEELIAFMREQMGDGPLLTMSKINYRLEKLDRPKVGKRLYTAACDALTATS